MWLGSSVSTRNIPYKNFIIVENTTKGTFTARHKNAPEDFAFFGVFENLEDIQLMIDLTHDLMLHYCGVE